MDEYVEQDRTLEWFGLDDAAKEGTTEIDGTLPNGVEKLTGDANDATNNPRAQASPTSSIENEKPPSPKEPLPPPSRKNVLAAAGAFEEIKSSPRADKPKVVFPQSRTLNSDPPSKSSMDEERRRRILGLSASDNANTTAVTKLSAKKDMPNGNRDASKMSVAT